MLTDPIFRLFGDKSVNDLMGRIKGCEISEGEIGLRNQDLQIIFDHQREIRNTLKVVQNIQ